MRNQFFLLLLPSLSPMVGGASAGGGHFGGGGGGDPYYYCRECEYDPIDAEDMTDSSDSSLVASSLLYEGGCVVSSQAMMCHGGDDANLPNAMTMMMRKSWYHVFRQGASIVTIAVRKKLAQLLDLLLRQRRPPLSNGSWNIAVSDF